MPFAFLLLIVTFLVYALQLNVQVDSQDEIFFGLAESGAADQNFLILPLVAGLVVALMASLALPLGPLLKSMPPLRAYAIDIIGSMVGIAAFTVLSASGTSPVVWFSVAAVLVFALVLGRGISGYTLLNGALLASIVFVVVWQGSRQAGDTWSPYYRITTYHDVTGMQHINVDGIPHQAMHPVDRPKEAFYEQVYRWFPGRQYPNVLIIGAGSGSDAAIALARGADHVDAVEIDPKIQQIGAQFHPNQPYSDPRVTPHINDGRAFLRNTTNKYDLVIFALPDSLTLVSSQSNVRLESFLFTEEAFASVRDHLTDDGIFVLYNYYRDPWLVNKLSSMLGEVFAHQPLVNVYGNHQAALAAGPLVASLGGSAPPGEGVTGPPAITGPVPTPATDNWPFLYLRNPFIAPHYIAAIIILLIGAVIAVALAARVTGTTIRRFSPHFFVLGVAFLLLETRAITSFSLLFGTTWLVNSLTFFAILASVLLAIFVNARWPIKRPTPYYVALFIAIAVAFLLPPESLLFEPAWLRYVVAAAVAFAPVFLANLVFSYSFRDTNTADMAFASNLLGAMVGGVLEYMALITGFQALLIVVALLYGLAWIFATRIRVGADRELTETDEPEVEQGAPVMPAPTPAPP